MQADDQVDVTLTPARWGWSSNVEIRPSGAGWMTMTLEMGWWRPAKSGAERVAQRWVKREKARLQRESRREVRRAS